MAYEDYLASPSWLNLPPVQQPTGLLATEPTMTPYQRAMAQMQQPTTPVAYQGLLGVGSSGGYKPGIFKQRTPEELLKGLQSITDYRGGGVRSEAEQARINAFFDAMTPAELAAFQQKNADFINMLLGPKLLMVVKDLLLPPKPVEMSPATYTPPAQIVNAGGYNPSLFSPVVTPVVTVGEGQAVSDGDAITPPSLTITPVSSIGGRTVSSGGVSLSSGSPMGGIASTGTSGQAAAAVAAANAAAASGVGTGGVSTSSGSPMGGISSGGGSAASGGGGGGGGGGCCFIMLEARYGDGTMDAVVRRYRDEKITDRNKRGYYKLAEVFVPLMRASKFFKFMVAKTFADPLVSYGKWHYGENRHGWIFKPVERFWMKVFNILGTDTKFIRENGETV